MSSSSSLVNETSPMASEVSPTPPRVAWGGAGMVFPSHSKAKSSLPSAKSRDTSIFSNIQSEDLALQLDTQETMKAYSSQVQQIGDDSQSAADIQSHDGDIKTDSVDVSSDHLIAQLMQYDLKEEHDWTIKLQERQINKNSKLSICLDNHRLLPSLETDRSGPHAWEGLTHDDISTHDHMFPIASSSGKKKKSYKQDKVEKSATGGHMDQRTSKDLIRLVNRGMLREVRGVISTGKEAVVYRATGGRTEEVELPEHCVTKIFKAVSGEFKTREKYIKDDPRFTKRMAETNHFKNILLWCEKEMRNMKRLHSSGVPCPEPLYHSGNVIVMSLIGFEDDSGGIEPAPQLKNLVLSSSEWRKVYQQTIKIMEDMTNKCRLVHGDLSEFNLLYSEGQVHVIDFGQSMDLSHSDALKFLFRDCENIARFFNRKGVADVMTGLETLRHITKIDFKKSSDDAEAVAGVESELHLWRSSGSADDHVYEFLWNAANGQKTAMKNAGMNASDDEDAGACHMDDWTTKRTDSSVIKAGGGGGAKKKKPRKNSKSEKNSLAASEVEGFCVVEAQDCSPAPLVTGIISSERNSLKRGQKVRFDDTDTAADTEDYNADADTDDVDADTTDADTDFNAAEDCDTEGYHGDADDTDNYPSDHNTLGENLPKDSKNPSKSSGQKSSTKKLNQLPQNTKRNQKKKNKKSAHRK